MRSESRARRINQARRRRAIRELSAAATAVSLTVLAAGGAAAAPGMMHEQAPVAGCTAPAGGDPNGKKFPAEPGMTINPTTGYVADLETTCGTVSIELAAAKAPRTVNSFVFLSGEEYFNKTKCHRMTTEGIYVLQCGDPEATGLGGPGYQVPDENLAGATYPAGTVAMANAGPNTNGSQFFLVYKDTQLPPKYTPFGKVTQGLDVLQNIADGGVRDGSTDGAPAADVVLEKVTVRN